MLNKKFAERLNKELDAIGLPEAAAERIDALAKLIKIPKFQAETLLNGISMPNEELLKTLADELEVDKDWLVGKDT